MYLAQISNQMIEQNLNSQEVDVPEHQLHMELGRDLQQHLREQSFCPRGRIRPREYYIPDPRYT